MVTFSTDALYLVSLLLKALYCFLILLRRDMIPTPDYLPEHNPIHTLSHCVPATWAFLMFLRLSGNDAVHTMCFILLKIAFP